ncbi:hypothetical protein CBR_g37340 [Chara braunii]|uniref:Reverse transcriptase domain-containing protein n=1 Tax=Chara braunii TaxID=69332 RepID=A0A388JZM4_CHABU|nr:hypothetical protein CBR_g37340 [Chara braunii]|eukprot:GBG63254.1 hypothetical protein CBR_g37340 [Chara braunii]
MGPGELEELRRQIDEMIDKGWIKPSESEFGAPVLFVPKKGGKLRMCIDYRGLNRITRKNVYPLPRIDYLLDATGGCKVFSKIDFKSGYHQIEVDFADQHKTTFKMHDGLYEFTVMPFGLTNAPTTFRSLMDKVLREQIGRFVVVYLDDILIFSKSMEEHLKHLEEVLTILKKTQLYLNLEKSEFGKDSVIYLGHQLFVAGLEPEATKVEVIRNWPQPVNVHEVRSFLGLESYYQKFVPRASIVSIDKLECFPFLGRRVHERLSSFERRLAGITITDDVLGEAVMACDMIEEEGGDVFGTVRSRARNEVGTFGQATDNDVDAIMPAVGLGEAAHEVHGDGLPMRAWRGVISFLERMEETMVLPMRMVKYCRSSVLAAIVPIEGLVLACEFVERVRNLGKVVNERTVIVGKAKEGTKFEEGLEQGVLDEGCDLRGVHTVAFSEDNVAEVFDARSGKRTFAELGVEFLLSEDREDLANMLEVGLEGGPKGEDVIKVHDDTDFEEVTEDVIHGGLECGGGIGEFERHYEELIVPEPRAECGLMGVVLADTDLVEATANVNLGEIFGSTKSIKELGDPRKGVLVLDRDKVQGVVVCAHAEFRSSTFPYKRAASTEGR